MEPVTNLLGCGQTEADRKKAAFLGPVAGSVSPRPIDHLRAAVGEFLPQSFVSSVVGMGPLTIAERIERGDEGGTGLP